MIGALTAAPAPVLVGAIAWGVLLGVLGTTTTRLDGWYYGLRFPAWKPPDWLFGPAWTTIFACATAALILGWTAPDATGPARLALAAAWVLNAALNVLWSWLFFRRRRPDWALWEIPALFGSIVLMVAVLVPLVPTGGWLLAPYLVWVSFAGVLNRAIVQLNAPFPGA